MKQKKIKYRAWDGKLMWHQYSDDEWGAVFMLPEEDHLPIRERFWYPFHAILFDPSFYKMMYSGLNDINGVEIYEGDFVLSKSGAKDMIRFENGQFRHGGSKSKANKSKRGLFAQKIFVLNMTVIGNRFENPDERFRNDDIQKRLLNEEADNFMA